MTNGILQILKWKEKRNVHVCSSIHTAEFVNTGRNDRITGQAIQKPESITDYNNYMGAVDRCDIPCLEKKEGCRWEKSCVDPCFRLCHTYKDFKTAHVIRKPSGEIGRDIIYDRGQDGGLVDDIIQESDEKKKCIKIKVSKKDERGSTSSSQRNIQDESGDRDDNGDEGHPDPGHEDFELREGQCPYCITRPCVATANMTAPWVGNGQPPSNANPQIRKGIYRRFWEMYKQYNLYGWLLPQYLDKKKRLGGGEWVVMQQREIMLIRKRT
ncbi:unnamed protein product [Mytilus edulis]|uniref:PiggyBac transposable element-derived protein domain-containing protein n=1 Tax=Mytilus edulis TaxID=6550 RepID=A0A8S3S8Z2_MYTED|nr:unnamed protein product [Mytilus edulis]